MKKPLCVRRKERILTNKSRTPEYRHEYYLRNKDKWIEYNHKIYSERKEQLLEYQKRYRKENREAVSQRQKDSRNKKLQLLINMKGDKCERCQITYPPEVYDFHHIDPRIKSFTISNEMGRSLKSLIIEAEKCALLCANCHRLLHKEERLNGTQKI